MAYQRSETGGTARGRVVAVHGSVVDLVFPEQELPAIGEAVEIEVAGAAGLWPIAKEVVRST